MMLLDEIFMEVFRPKEFIVLEISMPSSGFEYEFEYNSELDDIGKRIQDCLKKAKIAGIKPIDDVKRSRDAEIVLELENERAQIWYNQRRGNKLRDSIGDALMNNCKGLFSGIKVEGEPNVNNRFSTSLGPRYVDIRMKDIESGKIVNIEIKRGGSRYHESQKKKDALLAKSGKGPTYVVRGTAKRKGR